MSRRPRDREFPQLPAWPLHLVLERHMAETGRSRVDASSVLGITDRAMREWSVGVRHATTFKTADVLLGHLGLCWFDIWNEQTTRRWALEVVLYQAPAQAPTHKRHKNGHGRYRRGVRYYGDLGPDYEGLKKAAYAFTGELELVA